MEFDPPWMVDENPFLGTAELRLCFGTDGHAWELPGDSAPAQSATLAPDDGTRDSIDGEFTDLGFDVLTTSVLFRLEATPWYGDGVRPFAYDYVPAPEANEAQRNRIGRPDGTILLALSRDVELDDSAYRMGKAISWPKLDLVVYRVMDANVLPEFGPIVPEDVLAGAAWSVLDAVRSEMEVRQQLGDDTTVCEAFLRAARPRLLCDTVQVSHRPASIDSNFIAVTTFAAPQENWIVTLSYPYDKPTAFAWELRDPVSAGLAQYELRLVLSPGVRIEGIRYVSQLDQGLAPLPDSIVKVSLADSLAAVPAVNEVLTEGRFDPFPLREEPGPGLPPLDAVELKGRMALAEATKLSPGIVLLPVMLAGSPVIAGIAAVLAVPLGVMAYHYAEAQRLYVYQFGITPFGTPMSRSEADWAVRLAVVGLVLDAAAATSASAAPLVTAALVRLGPVERAALKAAAAAKADALLAWGVRQIKPEALTVILRLIAADNPAFTARYFAEMMDLDELRHLEMMRVFTEGYDWFRHADMKFAYTQYRKAATSRLARAGKSGSALEDELLEPIEWVTRTTQVRVVKYMRANLGESWRENVKLVRKYLPDKDLQEVFEWLHRPLPYDIATTLRATPGKAFGKFVQLDHPFEDYFVRALALQKGMDPLVLWNYNTAPTLLVPQTLGVARRLSGYSGYTHSIKSAGVDALIPREFVGEYTLQQMRDACVYVVWRQAGPDSPAIAMIDEAVTAIAPKIGQEVKVGFIPDPAQFAPGVWPYKMPSKGTEKRLATLRRRQELIIQGILDD